MVFWTTIQWSRNLILHAIDLSVVMKHELQKCGEHAYIPNVIYLSWKPSCIFSGQSLTSLWDSMCPFKSFSDENIVWDFTFHIFWDNFSFNGCTHLMYNFTAFTNIFKCRKHRSRKVDKINQDSIHGQYVQQQVKQFYYIKRTPIK